MTNVYKKTALIFLSVGIVALILGWVMFPERAWVSFSVCAVYFVTLPLGAGFFIAIQNVTGARWAEVFKRVSEAVLSHLPIAALTLFGILLGLNYLFHWSHHDVVAEDPILHGKSAYLNSLFFAFRMAGIVLIWLWLAWRLKANARRYEETKDVRYRKKSLVTSVLFLFCLGLTLTLASVDWVMSVEPHWYSTIFGIYNFSGMFVSALAAITLTCIFLHDDGLLVQMNENHFHDLGKFLFAFSAFWAYIWYCQFVLIWYGNIPEETVYYVERLKGDWPWLFYFNVLLNFVVPFFVLLPRASKRSTKVLKRVCIVLLIGRWLDLYLMIAPSILEEKANIGFIEFFSALGFAGLFMWGLIQRLVKNPILPAASAALEESLHHHQ